MIATLKAIGESTRFGLVILIGEDVKLALGLALALTLLVFALMERLDAWLRLEVEPRPLFEL